ncbi:MAG: Zn-ribbon domain-containing OB-fold protein [Acidimicrobiales bacterium]
MTTETVPAGTEGFLVPPGDEESAGFWEGTELGELRMEACGSCGAWRFPPRVMCPQCQSTEREWRAVSGRGTIWSFVVAHPPLLPAYTPFAPYPVVTVALEEDPCLRLVGNLVSGPTGAINEIDPSTIVIGEPVRVVFTPRRRPDGGVVHLPAWVRPAGS